MAIFNSYVSLPEGNGGLLMVYKPTNRTGGPHPVALSENHGKNPKSWLLIMYSLKPLKEVVILHAIRHTSTCQTLRFHSFTKKNDVVDFIGNVGARVGQDDPDSWRGYRYTTRHPLVN